MLLLPHLDPEAKIVSSSLGPKGQIQPDRGKVDCVFATLTGLSDCCFVKHLNIKNSGDLLLFCLEINHFDLKWRGLE